MQEAKWRKTDKNQILLLKSSYSKRIKSGGKNNQANITNFQISLDIQFVVLLSATKFKFTKFSGFNFTLTNLNFCQEIKTLRVQAKKVSKEKYFDCTQYLKN